MVLLRVPKLARGHDLRGDRLVLVPLLAHLLRHLPRDPLLLLVVREDGAAVLRADVAALAVQGGRVMHAVEELEELAVADDGRVERDLEGFGV